MNTRSETIFTLTPQIYKAIRETVGRRPAETGGMLGGDLRTGLVTHFHFDRAAACSAVAYSPDTATLNRLLDEWNAQGVRLLGFAHSHPPACDRPSAGDEVYAGRILAANPELPCLLVPIVRSSADGQPFRLELFVAERTAGGVNLRSSFFRVAEVEAEESPLAPLVTTREVDGVEPGERDHVAKPKPLPPHIDSELFARVVDAYDVPRLDQCRLVWFGVGGAAGCLEDLARAGVGQFVLVDPGLVEKCNLGTQAYYQSDIGNPKVRCLARRLRAINPAARIYTRQRYLEDFDDRQLEELARFAPLNRGWSGLLRRRSDPPLVTVLVGATDDFKAQARVNRLALQLGLPSVCCQLYLHALAGEVTFTHPQTTPACHRCILSGRFRAYLENSYQNSVGSAGSPICSTTRLNSLTASIVLAILHHGTNHPRWGSLLCRIGNRNLIQVRCHPDAERHLALTNFSESLEGAFDPQIYFDETIWRAQAPEHPNTGYARPCPDCGGHGNLARCKGTFADTRVVTK